MSQAGYKTIFAIATPPGRSAIAVIRISGPLAGAAPAVFGVTCPRPAPVSPAQTLSCFINFQATTAAPKAIDRKGGLDNYLLDTPTKRINSSTGMEVKERIEYLLRQRAKSPDSGAVEDTRPGGSLDT